MYLFSKFIVTVVFTKTTATVVNYTCKSFIQLTPDNTLLRVFFYSTLVQKPFRQVNVFRSDNAEDINDIYSRNQERML